MNIKIVNLRIKFSSPNSNKIPIRRADSGCAAARDIVAYYVPTPVNLEALSPRARFVAEVTRNTCRSGSVLKIYSRRTQEDLWRAKGKTEEWIQKIVRAYGPLQTPTIDWDFGEWYEGSETPEEFFERQVRHIVAAGASRMVGNLERPDGPRAEFSFTGADHDRAY